MKRFKYIIGYKYGDKCTKCFPKTKQMNFLIKDGKFLEAYNKIWKWVRNLIKKDLIVNQCMGKNI